MVRYMERRAAHDGTPWTRSRATCSACGNGQPGARRWRQVWSDHRLSALPAAR